MNALLCITLTWFMAGVSESYLDTTTSFEVLSKCDPPLVANANATEVDTYFETVYDTRKITCESGYRIPGRSSSEFYVICENGTWLDPFGSTAIPTCDHIGSCPIPHIDNGVVLHKNGGFMPGEEAPIKCDDFYEAMPYNRDPHIACQSDGSWRSLNGSTELPKCKEMWCKTKSIEHGRFKPFQDDYMGANAVPSGVAVEFICDPGYSLQNAKSVSVCDRGSWSTIWPNCISDSVSADACELPESIAHASYTIYGRPEGERWYAERTQVVYECDTGYEIMGSNTRTCRRGLWSGSTPSCVALPNGCEKPPKIEHGGYSCFENDHCEDGDYIPNGSSVYYYCENGYRMLNGVFKMTCQGIYWEGPQVSIPQCVKRTSCDPPMSIQNGNWWISSKYPGYPIGSEITYECHPGYRAINGHSMTTVTCLDSGYWSDYAPRCLPIDSYCSEPKSLEHASYRCIPDSCNLYKAGTEIEYRCKKGYRLNLEDSERIVCDDVNGNVKWKFPDSELYCIPEIHDSEDSSKEESSGISTVAVVVSTSCGVLGLLVIVMIIFLFQRRKGHIHRCRGRHSQPSYMPPPPAYSEMSHEARLATAVVSEHDRTALISFADGTQATLPSYDEVTRGRYPPRLHRFNSDASRGSRDYRPLPGISQQMRQGSVVREMSPDNRVDQRDGHSINSYPRGDALSVTFGSIDTMNVSDNTSTTVTLGTYESGASNPSLAASHRAAVGSMNSSNPSLATDEAPLLDTHDAVSHRSQTASPSIPEESEEAFPK